LGERKVICPRLAGEEVRKAGAAMEEEGHGGLEALRVMAGKLGIEIADGGQASEAA